MIWIVAYVSSVVGAFLTILAMTIIRNDQRHSIGRIGWLGLVLLSPPIGLILFLWLGGRKISAEHESRDLVDIPAQPGNDEPPRDDFEDLLMHRGLHRPTAGNQLRLLADVAETRAAFLDLIDKAEEAIYVTTFILDDREAANRIVDRLCARAEEGLQVRLMCDGFGSFQVSEEQLDRVRKAGGKAERFKPMSQLSRLAYLNFRNHRKLAVADGKRAILGGANLVQEQIAPHADDDSWLDLSLWIEGPAAVQLQAVFCSDWNFETKEDLPPPKLEDFDGEKAKQGARLTVMPIGPDGPDVILDDFWLYAIHQAKHRIWIATPYFIPPPLAMRSLESACRRGVDVRIMVPQESDLRPVDYARFDYFDDLEELGATLLRYPDKMVHAKVGIVDDRVALAGSANFDLRSFFLNYELSVVAHDSDTIAMLAEWYDGMAKKCAHGVTDRSRVRAVMATAVRMFASEL
ncbi:Major cardiolipin synthase ClsA [Rosistilla oblonga]|uniref:phospholipase D-like domain-containing protein n=1 Tax=Rosistilla oblonga TaxID=2527990 RepID=UPI0011890725|nr:phospholipase D-like domain-containing protein [Rosistilla oblonga]QDV14710.1 Major cardiolipin synthase ClsA [Rosistilla oblonga]